MNHDADQKAEDPLLGCRGEDETLLRDLIGQRSPQVNQALLDFDDDQGGAPTIGAWKRPRSS